MRETNSGPARGQPDEAELPLAGCTVVELGHSVAAPYAGLVLAELGAEVIKVERPGTGDDARAWGPPFVDGMSAVFHALNRHKKSVTADLKTPDGVETVRQLARTADVFIQNLKPGLAEEVGLGAEVLCADNSKLIYASIHAFGANGPLAARPGYDPLMQAFGGIMASQGEPGRPSVRVGTSIVDMGTGMWVVMGVMAALLRRRDTGRGGVVDTSLFETALGWMTYMLPIYEMSGRPPAKSGSGTSMISPYQAFPTRDGELVIADAGVKRARARQVPIRLPARSLLRVVQRSIHRGDAHAARTPSHRAVIHLPRGVCTNATTPATKAAGLPSAPGLRRRLRKSRYPKNR